MQRPCVFLLLSALLTLSACDNGDVNLATLATPSTPTTPTSAPPAEETVTIAASLGLIQGATVRLLSVDGTQIEGATGTLASNGTVTITHDGTHTGPVIVEVVGNDSAIYFDEATGTNQPFGPEQTLRAVAASIDTPSIGVSILTELAAQLADNLGDALTAADVAAINESIRSTFAPDVNDILTPPVLVSADNFAAGTLQDNDAGRYALRLAALASMATGETTPALAILGQLSEDLSDGDLDGVGVNGPVQNLVYPSDGFARAFATAAAMSAAALADSTLSQRETAVSLSGNLLQVLSDAGVTLPDEVSGRIDNNLPSGDFDLTISGNITTAGIDVPFSVALANVPAPSPSDTDAVTTEIEMTVAGLSGITDLDVTVVNNSSSQVTFDVTLAATQGAAAVTLSLRYDYVLASSNDDGASGGTDSGSGSGDGAGGACVFGGDSSPATIPSSFSASSFDLTFANAQTGSPISEGDMKTFLFSSSGGLFVDDVQLATNPVLCGGNTREASWVDAAAGLIYSLSDLEGTFNEVNVFSNSGTFYGQYKLPSEEASGPPAALTAVAGTYNTQVIEACTGDVCPNTSPVGESVTIIVGADGSVMFADLALSSENEGASFTDNTSGSVQPRLTLQNNGSEEGETVRVDLYIEADAVVAARLTRSVPCGSGCSQSKDIYTEVPELPTAVTAFFDRMVALSPITLTVVTDDATYFGKTAQLTGAPFGVAATCRSFELTAAKDVASVPSSLYRPRFSVSSGNAGVFDFLRQESRYMMNESGDEILSFNGGQIVVSSDDSVHLQEGFLDSATNFVSEVRDLSTSRQADVDSACANFHNVSGSVTSTEGGTITLGLVDTATDTTVATASFVLSTEAPVAFSFVAESGLQYELEVQFTSPTSLNCVVSNGTGTLADSDVTNLGVACSDGS